ncbi:MAG: hypothetical protein AAGC56_05015 [Pseudomonadota bacterium]
MRNVVEALIVAALIIAIALGMAYADGRGWVADGQERASGVVIGLILAVMGNFMPKKNLNDCASSFRVVRFAGAVFLVAGVAHAAIWLFAPLEAANAMAMSVVGAALAIVLARCVAQRARA